MKFIGRTEQLGQLMALWNKATSSLVTCQGRRRIGKSRLMDEFAARSGCRYLKLSGLAPRKGMTNDDQLRYFCQRLGEKSGAEGLAAKNWSEAFALLDAEVARQASERMVVLLDEISWMGKYDVDFPGYLKDAWDDSLKKHDNLILVLCGSVSSWIQKNILDSTGFVGRISLEIVLGELPVRDCLQFWRQSADGVSSREVFDLLSVTGGVPMYLEEIDPTLTTNENLRRMAFSKGGTLFKDFTRIFNDVFGAKASDKCGILSALAFESRTLSEITAALGKRRNGHLSEALEELELAGFVERDGGVNPATGREAKIARYRIRDNYTRFYLRFIEPYAAMIRRGAFTFVSLEALPGWDSILGLQFENLVLNNVSSLIARLGLDRSLVLSAGPYRKPPPRKAAGDGCQIDVLIQLRQAMYPVEVKRRNEIGPDVIDQMKRKVAALPNPNGVSVRPVLVYDGHLAPSVLENAYFAAALPAAEFLLS